MRWADYHYVSGDAVQSFWGERLLSAPRRLLYVCGLGFDPRMNDGMAMLTGAGCVEGDCLLVTYEEDESSPSREYAPYVEENESRLLELAAGWSVVTRSISLWSQDGRPVGSRQAAAMLASDPNEFATYTDIVLDPSALPKTVYLTLLTKFLFLGDQAASADAPFPNLHVLVSDSREADGSIREIEPDENESFLHSFSGDLNHVATEHLPRVWFPLIGEGCGPQLKRIHERISPDEICPVLPSPAANPRRGDDLLREHRELLFDGFLLDPGNVIYASESNPFEVYRQLRDAIVHYSDVLAILGGSKAVVSNLSSKLASIGSLLACYELRELNYKVGVVHVEAHGYEASSLGSSPMDSVLYSLWIGGAPYE